MVPDDSYTRSMEAFRNGWRFHVSRVEWCPEGAEISGWCRAVSGTAGKVPCVDVEGGRVLSWERFGARADVARLFQVEPSSVSSFRATLGVENDDGSVVVSPHLDAADEKVRLANTWLIPSSDHGIVVPPDENIDRVTGRNTSPAFVYGGATHCHRMVQALRLSSGFECSHFSNVVDWGCGAGRVLQHLARLWPNQVSGVDVDPKNVAWCRQNIPEIAVGTVDWDPPTGLSTASLDLVFGFSLFSHISQSNQHKWLEEFKRLVKPGGFLVLTTLGIVSTASRNAEPDFYSRLNREGFVEWPNRNQLADVKPSQEAYVNIAMSEDFARRLFSKYFVVKDVFPGLGPQDAWVLQCV